MVGFIMEAGWKEMIRILAGCALVFIILICIAISSLVPIPLARGLWMYAWWGAYSDHTFFKLHGLPVTNGEIDRFVQVDDRPSFAIIYVFIPLSPFWKFFAATITRNRVLG